MCKGCELETPGGNSRHFAAVSVSPFRLTIRLLCDRQTCRPSSKGPPAYRYPTAFFSASAIVTKALCEKAILNFVCFYFMVITIVIVVPVDVFFLFSQYR